MNEYEKQLLNLAIDYLRATGGSVRGQNMSLADAVKHVKAAINEVRGAAPASAPAGVYWVYSPTLVAAPPGSWSSSGG